MSNLSTASSRAAEGVHLPLMLALTFSTGLIDAVGYLGLDRVFTGNMTGNVVVLGMALAHADGLPVAGPVVALSGFLAGAAIAGSALRGEAAGWSQRTSAIFACVAVALGTTSGYLLAVDHPPHAAALTVTGLLGTAMGAQAGTARHLAVKEVTTVVVTSTITALAAESWFGNRAGAQVPRRGSAVALILLGACTGALLLRWQLGAAVALAASITALVAVLGERSRHP
ncbi:MAG: YoaK family protein [Marmoricola sp.]